MHYFDYNATAPLSAVAKEAWLKAQSEAWPNPASPYRDAARVKLRLDAARETLAGVFSCADDRVIFTSGATESANAVAAYLARTLPSAARLAVNPTEHPCVLASFGEAFSGRLDFLSVEATGEVRPQAIASACYPSGGGAQPAAIVMMAANNETGILHPWREAAKVCRESGVALVCDATQWIGKLPAEGLGLADWVFGSAHKFGGPKGVGFLIRASQADGFAGQRGGEQQHGHRGGTEDYPGVAAMVAALVEAERSKVLFESQRLTWRNRFEDGLRAALHGVKIIGRDAERLWNTVLLTLPDFENSRWVAGMDRRGFSISTGSACATGKGGPSHVLAAMHVGAEQIRRTVRVSSGWETTSQDWDALAHAFREVHADLARVAGSAVVSL